MPLLIFSSSANSLFLYPMLVPEVPYSISVHSHSSLTAEEKKHRSPFLGFFPLYINFAAIISDSSRVVIRTLFRSYLKFYFSSDRGSRGQPERLHVHFQMYPPLADDRQQQGSRKRVAFADPSAFHIPTSGIST